MERSHSFDARDSVAESHPGASFEGASRESGDSGGRISYTRLKPSERLATLLHTYGGQDPANTNTEATSEELFEEQYADPEHLRMNIERVTRAIELRTQRLAAIQERLQQVQTQVTRYHEIMSPHLDALEHARRSARVSPDRKADFGTDVIEQEAVRMMGGSSFSSTTPEERVNAVREAYEGLRRRGTSLEREHAERMLSQYEEKRQQLPALTKTLESLEGKLAPLEKELERLKKLAQSVDWQRKDFLVKKGRTEQRLAEVERQRSFEALERTMTPEQRSWIHAISEAHFYLLETNTLNGLHKPSLAVFEQLAKAYEHQGIEILERLRPYLSPRISFNALVLQLERYVRHSTP